MSALSSDSGASAGANAVEAGLIPANAGAPQAGSHHEVVAKVRARFLGQNQALQSQGKQLEEIRQQLTDITHQRDQLRSTLTDAQNETARQQANNSQRIARLETELAAARQTVKLLQAKSQDDDKAIAELVALLESAPDMAPAAGQEAFSK